MNLPELISELLEKIEKFKAWMGLLLFLQCLIIFLLLLLIFKL